MLNTLRLQIAVKMLEWSEKLQQFSADMKLRRERPTILVFFHGHSLAHTIRPLVAARALRERGFDVVLAGRGPHVGRVRQEGFVVHDVETLPQSRMDRFVERGEYAYYDMEWIERCVRSERLLMQSIGPDLAIHDMKPTVSLSARLEGIDDARITQAYTQPGYPHPVRLMERFSTEAGPFEEYLAQHAVEVKPQRHFYLLADIPEFHPPGKEAPGFHYVGPLLDRPPEPQRLDLLDEGWDTSLPLIYLTCGSSGRYPEYLDELFEAVRGEPYRFLVTTAGRWSGEVYSDRVRVVDFLPGEWVLQRAHAIVGVLGIGSIYQALHCGVPIIGSPEHLDQEYHLNRVEALGLGVKLDRRAFGAREIIETLKNVLGSHEAFRNRCALFARYLKKWNGGAAVADLVCRHFQTYSQGYRAEQPYLEETEEFLRYLDATSPEQISIEKLEDILYEGLKRGLPHTQRAGKFFFDHLDSWNWLYDNEARFFEADYRALEAKRRHFLIRTGGTIRCRSEWQRYRANYRFRLLAGELQPGQQVKLFIPYPIHREGHQHDVRLICVSSSDMKTCFAPTLGFFYGYVFTVDGKADFYDSGYTCELSVREGRGAGGKQVAGITEQERRRYLELPSGLLQKPEVVQFRRELNGNASEEKEDRARAIYESLARNTRFKKTKDRTQGLTYSTVAVLREKGGHCITLSRAFIALCRGEGIPAREVAGGLLGYPVGRDRYVMASYREPVFGHTWVEIFLEGKGWVPVEFHGIVIGEKAMTRENVKDPGLRKLIRENSDRYFDYYFGHVDNQRLLCSNAVKRIPECLVENVDYPPGHRQRWQSLFDLKFECQLEVECL